jgi:hypothetical protein
MTQHEVHPQFGPGVVPDFSTANQLRSEIGRLRQDLAATTEDYRLAIGRHDGEQVIRLLRTRSKLMRELLERQCELLLAMRAEDGAARIR